MVASTAMCIGVLVGVGQTPAAAGHYVFSEVQGSAYGFFSNISLSGAPAETRGPDPMVALTGDGSAVPLTATASTGSAQYGTATFFSSGPLHVSTVGLAGDRITGDTGSDVITTATVEGVNASGTEILTASSLTSTCTAGLSGNSSRTTPVGISGFTVIYGGTVQVSEGDPGVEGDETTLPVPIDPDVNTIYQGQMQGTGEPFRYVFNEQILNGDGSFTVNAAHLYLLGPTTTGELIIGQSVCGVRQEPTIRSHPYAQADAYSTGFETVLHVPAPGVLANDIQDPFFDHEHSDIGPLTAELRTQPAHGSLVLNRDGSFTYSPDAGFTGVDTFRYIVSDTTGGEEATVRITVGDAPPPATVSSVVVTPSEVTIADGGTQQYTATATYSDGSTVDVTAGVTWSSSDTGVATITSAGLASGEAPGTTTISATTGSLVGSTDLTVNPVVDDTTPPSLHLPADITVVATDLSGAVVEYSFSASDARGVASSSCTPASGTVFPIGTTTVTCTATDTFANAATGSFTVTVIGDTTPPVLQLPAHVAVDATGPSGALVGYSFSATDARGIASSSCTPASGSTFPIGTTTVTCTATDTFDNTATGTFTVSVKGADEQLTDLELTVEGIAAGTSLADKVDVAQSYVASGDTARACETLRAFVNEVRALSGRRISRAQALGLVATAERIQTVIGC